MVRARRITPDDAQQRSIVDYYRFRTCPACHAERMMFQVNRDALQCPAPACGLVITGKEDRMGSDGILHAVENHRRKREAKDDRREEDGTPEDS